MAHIPLIDLSRNKVDPFDFVKETNNLLKGNGLLLVTSSEKLKPNAMTIGWGLVGTMWRRPFFATAVRLSRYTHMILEESDEFTVCLPAKGMENTLDVCGNKSGRDMDKFKELGLTATKSRDLKVPYIAECPVHYECKVAFKTQLRAGQLESTLEKEVYSEGDYHTIYFGQILGLYAENGAHEKLAK